MARESLDVASPPLATHPLRPYLLLLCLFLSVYLLPLGVRPLIEPDETRYGEIPREMIASGNWITPHLNGLRYFEKPPLGYWLIGVSILTFGENEFAIRLPSAISVGLSALLILLLVSHATPKKETWSGVTAILVFLTSLEVPIVGTFGVLDSIFAFTLTMTMTCFFLASQTKKASFRRQGLLIAAGVSCGLAFLVKGFLALAVPGLVMGAYLIWERRWRDLLDLAWLPFITATMTTLPWSLAIHHQEPDFWNFFFWHEHVNRFLGGGKAQHAESFWYFFLISPALFLPWTFLVPAAGIGLNADTPLPATRQLIHFCLAWFCLPFFFFSLSAGKLLTYILPCFPPFAILVSIGLVALLRTGAIRSFQFGAKTATLFYGLLTVIFLVIQFIGINGITTLYSKNWQWLLAISGLLAMTLLPLAAISSRNNHFKLLLFGLSPALLLAVAPFLLPDITLEKKSPGALLLKHKKEIKPDFLILSDERASHAACWYLQRSDILQIADGGETTYGFGYNEAKGRLISETEVKNKILTHKGKTILIARASNYRQWIPYLPNPATIDDNGQHGYIFATF